MNEHKRSTDLALIPFECPCANHSLDWFISYKLFTLIIHQNEATLTTDGHQFQAKQINEIEIITPHMITFVEQLLHQLMLNFE